MRDVHRGPRTVRRRRFQPREPGEKHRPACRRTFLPVFHVRFECFLSFPFFIVLPPIRDSEGACTWAACTKANSFLFLLSLCFVLLLFLQEPDDELHLGPWIALVDHGSADLGSLKREWREYKQPDQLLLVPLLIGNHQKTAERIDYGRGARYLPIHVFIHVEADTVPILLLVLYDFLHSQRSRRRLQCDSACMRRNSTLVRCSVGPVIDKAIYLQ